MQHPSYTLLYVDNPLSSADFYRGLLGIEPVECSPGFALFVLENGHKLGMWTVSHVEPAANQKGGGGELCFTVESDAEVDAQFARWTAAGLTMAQTPTQMDFGYTFVALDPDGHRLRVFAPGAM
ncbi:VOC family protein [Burkholderiaceae bacterium DAT-1]|nr:VOC family protein [Burkholderiaceae bacterium DAT-1]